MERGQIPACGASPLRAAYALLLGSAVLAACVAVRPGRQTLPVENPAMEAGSGSIPWGWAFFAGEPRRNAGSTEGRLDGAAASIEGDGAGLSYFCSRTALPSGGPRTVEIRASVGLDGVTGPGAAVAARVDSSDGSPLAFATTEGACRLEGSVDRRDVEVLLDLPATSSGSELVIFLLALPGTGGTVHFDNARAEIAPSTAASGAMAPGGVPSGPAIAAAAIAAAGAAYYAAGKRKRRIPGDGPAEISFDADLSPREKDVAALLARGLSNKEIADALFISVKTVNNHVYNIYGKMGIRSRSEFFALATREKAKAGNVS